MKGENNELAMAYSKKEDESRQLREVAIELEKKWKKSLATSKEANKIKRTVKEREKELSKLRQELT